MAIRIEFVLSLVVCVAFLTQIDAYAYIKEAKSWKGRCIDDLGNRYKINDHWFNNKSCERRECVKMDGKLYEAAVGCGVIMPPEGCVIVKTKGRYPDCCGEIQCSEKH